MSNFLKFLGIDGSNKIQFMSWIGGIFILFYLFSLTYSMFQINYFFAKGKLSVEVYERISINGIKDLLGIVTMIVVFFFKNQKNESNES